MHNRREDYPNIHTSEKAGRRGWTNDQVIENLEETERIEAEKRQRQEDQKETDHIERDKRSD
jgi:hypothetical protein